VEVRRFRSRLGTRRLQKNTPGGATKADLDCTKIPGGPGCLGEGHGLPDAELGADIPSVSAAVAVSHSLSVEDRLNSVALCVLVALLASGAWLLHARKKVAPGTQRDAETSGDGKPGGGLKAATRRHTGGATTSNFHGSKSLSQADPSVLAKPTMTFEDMAAGAESIWPLRSGRG